MARAGSEALGSAAAETNRETTQGIPVAAGMAPVAAGTIPAETGTRPAETGVISVAAEGRPVMTGRSTAAAGMSSVSPGLGSANTWRPPAVTGEGLVTTGHGPVAAEPAPVVTGASSAGFRRDPASAGTSPSETVRVALIRRASSPGALPTFSLTNCRARVSLSVRTVPMVRSGCVLDFSHSLTAVLQALREPVAASPVPLEVRGPAVPLRNSLIRKEIAEEGRLQDEAEERRKEKICRGSRKRSRKPFRFQALTAASLQRGEDPSGD